MTKVTRRTLEQATEGYTKFVLPFYISNGGDGSANLRLTKTLREAEIKDHSYDGYDVTAADFEDDDDGMEFDEDADYGDGCNEWGESTASTIDLYYKSGNLYRAEWGDEGYYLIKLEKFK